MSVSLDSYSSGDILTSAFSFLTPQEVHGTSSVSKGWKAVAEERLNPKDECTDHPLQLHAIWNAVNKEKCEAIQKLNIEKKNLQNKINVLEANYNKEKVFLIIGGVIFSVTLIAGIYQIPWHILFGLPFGAVFVCNDIKYEIYKIYECRAAALSEIEYQKRELKRIERDVKQLKSKIATIENIKGLVKEGFTSPHAIELWVWRS